MSSSSFRSRWLRTIASFPLYGALYGAAASLALASPCLAEGSLSFDASACPAAWASGLERFVIIELGAAPADRPAGALAIGVRCEGDSVEIEASEPVAASTRRRMDLSATADSVRSRVVALAIAGWSELALMARREPRRRSSLAAADGLRHKRPHHSNDPALPPVVQLDSCSGGVTAALASCGWRRRACTTGDGAVAVAWISRRHVRARQ